MKLLFEQPNGSNEKIFRRKLLEVETFSAKIVETQFSFERGDTVFDRIFRNSSISPINNVCNISCDVLECNILFENRKGKRVCSNVQREKIPDKCPFAAEYFFFPSLSSCQAVHVTRHRSDVNGERFVNTGSENGQR